MKSVCCRTSSISIYGRVLARACLSFLMDHCFSLGVVFQRVEVICDYYQLVRQLLFRISRTWQRHQETGKPSHEMFLKKTNSYFSSSTTTTTAIHRYHSGMCFHYDKQEKFPNQTRQCHSHSIPSSSYLCTTIYLSCVEFLDLANHPRLSGGGWLLVSTQGLYNKHK